MADEYDPTLLLQRARTLREAAKSASPTKRDILLATADAAEARAALSLETPAISDQPDTSKGESTQTPTGVRNFGGATTPKVPHSISA